MKRLVLDTSGLKATTRSAFESARDKYELLVTQDIFAELYTHAEQRGAFSKERASRDAYAQLVKAASLGAVHPLDAVRFEVENGTSARQAPVRELAVPEARPQLSTADLAEMRREEAAMAGVFAFRHPRQCEDAFRELRRCQGDSELWLLLANILQCAQTRELIRQTAIERFSGMAERNGWSVSTRFRPERDWVTFGAWLAWFGYCDWKYARHGDDVPQPSKPANPVYDMRQVAHIAICEGLLSCDNDMLNIAWACYPEKRDGLMTYNQTTQKIVPYEPTWGR